MNLQDLKDKKIGIFGFGDEGRSVFKYLYKHGCRKIVVFDENNIAGIDRGIDKRIGKFEDLKADDIEIVFRSPGVKKKRLDNIFSQKVIISSATNLFFANKKGKIIAVTGTKGKSTTVQLITYMLNDANLKVFTGGNIGKPILEFLDETTDETYSVVELSSFQLQDLAHGPDIAVVLPVFADHLDYHDDLDEYLDAKSMIVKYMKPENVVFCARQDGAQKIIKQAKAKIIFFGEGDDHNISSLASRYKIPEINLLAAFGLGRFMKIKVNLEDIAKNFSRLPFRIQFLRGDKNIDFYNDSAATNPISTIKALETMDVPYLLIAGGSSKNLSYENLAKAMQKDKNLKFVYLIGDTASEISKELQKINFEKPIFYLENLDSVFEKIKGGLTGVKAILFSPASASFDQFRNYKDRGDYFNQKVKQFKTQ